MRNIPASVAVVFGLHAGRTEVQVNTLQPVMASLNRPSTAPPIFVFLELFSGDRKTMNLFKEMGAIRPDKSNVIMDRYGCCS